MTTFNNPTLRFDGNKHVDPDTVRDFDSDSTNFHLAAADPHAVDGLPLPAGRPFRLRPNHCTGSGELSFRGPIGAWKDVFNNNRAIILKMVIPGAAGTTETDCTVQLTTDATAFLPQVAHMRQATTALKRDVGALIDQLQGFLVEELEPFDDALVLDSGVEEDTGEGDGPSVETPTNGCTRVRLHFDGEVSTAEFEFLCRFLAEWRGLGRDKIVWQAYPSKGD